MMLSHPLKTETDTDLSLKLKAPACRKAIRKYKKPASLCSEHKRLSIEIPEEAEMPVAEKRKGGLADMSQSGSFYTAVLKKGDYRRYNEDRVI